MADQKLPPATNESYEIKRVQMEAAACVAAFMHQLGAKYAPRRPNAWVPLNYIGFLQSDRWRKDSQVIDFHHDSHDHRKSEFVAFSDVFYGPESDFIEGHAEDPPERDAERRRTHEDFRQLAGRMTRSTSPTPRRSRWRTVCRSG